MPRPVLLLSLIAALLIPISGNAQSPQQAETPRFFIDAISVQGIHYSSERVILAETRLQAGREYTEPQLRAGAARAARLPFVVRVDPRLEKGSRRGAYRLVLDIVETKPLFFGANYHSGRIDEPDEHDATAGARMFIGRSGALHGAATAGNDTPRFELGYTQYDLFRRGVFLSVTASYDRIAGAPEELYTSSANDHLVGQLVAGVPLRGNNALRLTYTNYPIALRSGLAPVGFPPTNLYEIARAATTQLAWIYDSTDDPLFPNSGTRSLLTAAIRQVPFSARISGRITEPFRRGEQNQPWFTGDIRHIWSLSPRQSVSAHLGDSFIRRDIAFTGFHDHVNQAVAGAGYAFTIWGGDHPSRRGDLRAELGIVAASTTVRVPSILGSREELREYALQFGITFRNQWGIVRLRFDAEHSNE